jgi:tetratricopeptide (TPR) repeat protein
VASKKATIAKNVQEYLKQSDWKTAITEMEKLFAIDQDPLVRVRIGDARRKLNQKAKAIREYIRAADLFAEKGFVVKALAQYSLALRLGSSNKDVRSKMEILSLSKTVTELKREPGEYRVPQPFGCDSPHSSFGNDLYCEKRCRSFFDNDVCYPAEQPVHG